MVNFVQAIKLAGAFSTPASCRMMLMACTVTELLDSQFFSEPLSPWLYMEFLGRARACVYNLYVHLLRISNIRYIEWDASRLGLPILLWTRRTFNPMQHKAHPAPELDSHSYYQTSFTFSDPNKSSLLGQAEALRRTTKERWTALCATVCIILVCQALLVKSYAS